MRKTCVCLWQFRRCSQCRGFRSRPSLERPLLSISINFRDMHDRIACHHYSCVGNALLHGHTGAIDSSANRDLGMYADSRKPAGQLLLHGSPFCISEYTFVDLLKACIERKDLKEGLFIHNDITQKGLLERNSFVGCTLINMYVKCGCLESAERVFQQVPERDIVSWTALVTGYVDYGFYSEALNSFEVMQSEGIIPDVFVYVCMFKACSKLRNLGEGRNMHAKVVKNGFLGDDAFLKCALIDMLVKCGVLEEAQAVFDKQQPICCNAVTWTALISGYVEHEHCEEALLYMEKMQYRGISPTPTTFLCGLISCGILGSLVRGYQKHAEVVKKGFETDTLIGNALVDMYAKCGSLADAQEVFNKHAARNVVSFNVLIGAYAEQGHGEEALQQLENMHHERISPNATTLTCSLKACRSAGATGASGQKLHADIVKKGLLESDALLGNSLVDMYTRSVHLEEAREVFDRLAGHDVVSWTILIAGYSEYGDDSKALHCFHEMQDEGIAPGEATFLSGLIACGNLGFIGEGQQMHGEILSKGLEKEVPIDNALVSMYAKCGLIGAARCLFDRPRSRDVVACNALMTGYAHRGECVSVLGILERMRREGIRPDATSFVCIINAYSHEGLSLWKHFEAICEEYGFEPALEHYNCAVDLVARAGRMQSAIAIITKMPLQPSVTIWRTLLGACRKWGDVGLAKYAFDEAVQLDAKDDATYLCMFHIYSVVGMEGEAGRIEMARTEVANRFHKRRCE